MVPSQCSSREAGNCRKKIRTEMVDPTLVSQASDDTGEIGISLWNEKRTPGYAPGTRLKISDLSQG
jgi:hypothetical protein